MFLVSNKYHKVSDNKHHFPCLLRSCPGSGFKATGSYEENASVPSRPSGASRGAPSPDSNNITNTIIPPSSGRSGELTFKQGSGAATTGFNGKAVAQHPTDLLAGGGNGGSGGGSSSGGRAGELSFKQGSGAASAGFNSGASSKAAAAVPVVIGGGGGGSGDGGGSSGGGGSGGSSGDKTPREGSGGPEEDPDAAPWVLFGVGLGGAMYAVYDRIVKPQQAREAAAKAEAAAAAAVVPGAKKSCCGGGKVVKVVKA